MQSKNPRILMFAPSCYPPSGAEAIVTSKLVLAMIDMGWKVKVVSQADFGHFYPLSDADQWEALRPVVENIIGVNDKGLAARLIGKKLINKLSVLMWTIKAVRAGRNALKKNEYDFLLSRATPQYGHLPALIINRLTKIPWIANWSDPLPPKKAPPPYGKGYNARISFFLQKYYYALFKYADWHTFPCERVMRYYWQMVPDIKFKSSVIPHIALRRFNVQKNEDKNIFTICHTGGLALRDPSVFLGGLNRFVKETSLSKKVRMVFVGDDSRQLKTKVKAMGLDKFVDIKTAKKYEETLSIAAEASVLLVIEAPSQEGIYFPSKFVDFIQTGRPVLAVSPVPGTLHDIITRYGGGIAVDNRSTNEVLEALNELYRAWEKGTLTENYGSGKLYNHFSADDVLREYLDIFDTFNKKGILKNATA